MIEETSDLMVRTSETNLQVASKDLTTFGQIIALWPDLTRFAAETGIDYRSAQVMRSRGYINGRYWKRIACAAQARGLWQITPALLAVSQGVVYDGGRGCGRVGHLVARAVHSPGR